MSMENSIDMVSAPVQSNDQEEFSASCSTATETQEFPTILRIKRRIDEDPVQSLLLSFKRFKGDDKDSTDKKCGQGLEGGTKDDVVSRVLRFAGTVTSNDPENALNETITQALSAAAKHEREALTSSKSYDLKRRAVNSQEKSRANFQSSISTNRFKLVARKRETADETDDSVLQSTEEVVKELYNLYDVVEEPVVKKSKENQDPRELGAVTCNGVPLLKEKVALAEKDESMVEETEKIMDFDYVFDLYLANGGVTDADQDISFLDMCEEDFRFEDYQTSMNENDSDNCGEIDGEEDSNDEGNWRNDYPDSDQDNSKASTSYFGTGEVEELGSHIGRLNFEDSSSDPEDYYSSPSVYTSYKRRVTQEMESNLSNEVVSVSSEDSD